MKNGVTYLDDTYYSEQHSKIDPFYPKNSLRTYIQGNSNLSKLHLWTTTNNTELNLKKDLEEVKKNLERYPIDKESCDFIIYCYRDISNIYEKLKKKKNKDKIFIYCVFFMLKIYNKNPSHKVISSLLNKDTKKICKSIKEVSEFLNNTEFYDKYENKLNKEMSISYYIISMKLSFDYMDSIQDMLKELKNDPVFSPHNDISLLASIFYYYCLADKETIKKLFLISDTTLYQIKKKIMNKYRIDE